MIDLYIQYLQVILLSIVSMCVCVYMRVCVEWWCVCVLVVTYECFVSVGKISGATRAKGERTRENERERERVKREGGRER